METLKGFDVEIELELVSPDSTRFRLEARLRTSCGITVLFGPSGAGKSTLLLAMLGSLRPARGRIGIAGRTVFDAAAGMDLPVRERRVGIVFQDALLFPHLDALGNVAFGLRGKDRRDRAEGMLRRMEAGALARRRPSELSGGERQRVAFARALAARPAALLLDEPFSALDAPSRQGLGSLLIELQAEMEIPFLHVTHDLGEALRLGREIAIMDAGRIVQSGPVDSIFSAPSPAATRSLGSENVFTATIVRHFPQEGFSEVDLGGTRAETGLLDLPPGSRVPLGLRAEDVLLALEEIRTTSARNVIRGTVEQVDRRGPTVEARVLTPALFRVIVTPAAARELRLSAGQQVFLLIKAHAFHRLT